MAFKKYYVVCTGYTYTIYHPYNQLYYEEWLYRPVYKRTFFITAVNKAKAITKSRYEMLDISYNSNLDFNYLVKKVKSNHFKYTTKRIAKRRCKQ